MEKLEKDIQANQKNIGSVVDPNQLKELDQLKKSNTALSTELEQLKRMNQGLPDLEQLKKDREALNAKNLELTSKLANFEKLQGENKELFMKTQELDKIKVSFNALTEDRQKLADEIIKLKFHHQLIESTQAQSQVVQNQLLTENGKLKAEIERFKEERDAALKKSSKESEEINLRLLSTTDQLKDKISNLERYVNFLEVSKQPQKDIQPNYPYNGSSVPQTIQSNVVSNNATLNRDSEQVAFGSRPNFITTGQDPFSSNQRREPEGWEQRRQVNTNPLSMRQSVSEPQQPNFQAPTQTLQASGNAKRLILRGQQVFTSQQYTTHSLQELFANENIFVGFIRHSTVLSKDKIFVKTNFVVQNRGQEPLRAVSVKVKAIPESRPFVSSRIESTFEGISRRAQPCSWRRACQRHCILCS